MCVPTEAISTVPVCIALMPVSLLRSSTGCNWGSFENSTVPCPTSENLCVCINSALYNYRVSVGLRSRHIVFPCHESGMLSKFRRT